MRFRTPDKVNLNPRSSDSKTPRQRWTTPVDNSTVGVNKTTINVSRGSAQIHLQCRATFT
jgi:hypothetical protein